MSKSDSADSITIRHKASGTLMDVGKTAYDAGEYDPDEFEAVSETAEPKVKK